MAFIYDVRSEGHAVESTCRVLPERGLSASPRGSAGVWRRGRPLAARTVSDAVLAGAISWPPEHPEGHGPTPSSGKPTTRPSTRRSNP